ncbi:hypothetical protein [Glaciimonas soli]|uniref:Lipoprotein n=1 Tax=Glaciimonas soli TaxID=2590999 RepID=A0A843YTX8_9BURK|nr:hypothetical protein [Glaciimonas soli]MQR01063.1 hypothetical protein [Glaciimonas soli]
MKAIKFFSGLFFAFSLTSGIAHAAENNQPVIVGADVDAHGCKPSTGYSWSVLQNECVQYFSYRPRLNDLRRTTQAGFFWMNPEKKKVEFFGGGFSPSLVLTLQRNKWSQRHPRYQSTDGRYIFTSVKGKWVLLDNRAKTTNKRLFEQE